jgi:hypothetical protein
LNYRATPLDDTRRHFSSITDDQLSQASTSTSSTASSSQKLPSSRSMESQLGGVLADPPRHKLSAPPTMEEDGKFEDEELVGSFPNRQLSLSSASRKRLKPRPSLVKQEASEDLDDGDEGKYLTVSYF